MSEHGMTTGEFPPESKFGTLEYWRDRAKKKEAALAAEVKRREEAEAELSTKDEFIADLCKAHDASLAALRKQVVELEVHLDNQAKANIEMHNVKETFQYAANKQVAELTAANEKRRQEVIELTIQMHELEAERDRLRDGLELAREVIRVACGTEAPYVRIAISKIDAALTRDS